MRSKSKTSPSARYAVAANRLALWVSRFWLPLVVVSLWMLAILPFLAPVLMRYQLTHRLQSDLAIFDVPVPHGVAADSFYVTLMHTLLRGLMVTFQLDESELEGFLMPDPASPGQQRIILYETSLGGTGVLASLKEPDRLAALVARSMELLHEGDPEGGCERACYECLLSFYNQRDHDLIDRTPILAWLQSLTKLDIATDQPGDGERLVSLRAACQSDLERAVLDAIVAQGILLPDASQQVINDRDGGPLAIADFYYDPRIVVFVDGSPHYLDYVRLADDRKRRRLLALGYRIVIISGTNIQQGITQN
jgi:hypothetical protein